MGRRSAVTGFGCRIATSSCLLLCTLTTAAFAQAPAARPTRAPSSLHDTISVVQLRVPEKARELFTKALGDFTNGRLDQALQRTNAALAVTQRFPNALTLRGYIELRRQQFEAADADFAHAIEVDPTFTLAFLYHGAALNRLGKYDEALLNLNRYNEVNSTSWETYYEMSKAWMGKHDFEHTLAAVNKSALLGADPEVTSAIHFIRGRALAGLHQYAAARTELQACLTPQTSAGIAGLAREMLTSIDQDTAVAAK